MSSILTNSSAMVALSTLTDVNRGLEETQNRVSSGLKISSGKDNAAYFAISETMTGDSGMFKAINEGLTSTKNSVSTARLGAETVSGLAEQFAERVAFAQGSGVNLADVQSELDALVDQIGAAIDQSTFNGDDMVNAAALTTTAFAAASTVTAVSGISRDSSGTFSTTTISFEKVDLNAIKSALDAIDLTAATASNTVEDMLSTAETQLAASIDAATALGVAENTLEGQQEFLEALTDTLDSGVSAMVDANMEEEAARLQAYQVQQQLATQSLSIANQQPQNILSLFQ